MVTVPGTVQKWHLNGRQRWAPEDIWTTVTYCNIWHRLRPEPDPGHADEARNCTPLAFERTAPFALLTCTLIITWYTRHGHSPARITARRRAQPWYPAKTDPAFADMLTQLRRVLITARISRGSAAHPTPEQTKTVLAAWHAAAA